MRDFWKFIGILIPAIILSIMVIAVHAAFLASRVVPMDNPIPETQFNTGRDGSYADQKHQLKKQEPINNVRSVYGK